MGGSSPPTPDLSALEVTDMVAIVFVIMILLSLRGLEK